MSCAKNEIANECFGFISIGLVHIIDGRDESGIARTIASVVGIGRNC